MSGTKKKATWVVQPMDNLSQGSVLGPDGPPPVKKPRTDSETGEFGLTFLNFVERGVWLSFVR